MKKRKLNMETVHKIEKKIKTTQDLHSVVKTMKALAAANIRQYEKAVYSLKSYTETMDLAFRALFIFSDLASKNADTEPEKTDVCIIFGSDQGMCGQINESTRSHLISNANSLGISKEHTLMIVCGARVTALLGDEGYEISETVDMPGSAEAVTSSAQEIIFILDSLSQKTELKKIVLIYNKHESQASFGPKHETLIPVSQRYKAIMKDKKWPRKVIPLITMDRKALLASVTRHYLLSSLYRALAESLASENAARLASMQGAQKNIEERLSELTSRFQMKRQMSITEELLDIISGFEALRKETEK